MASERAAYDGEDKGGLECAVECEVLVVRVADSHVLFRLPERLCTKLSIVGIKLQGLWAGR